MARRLRHKDLRAFSNSIQLLYRVSDLDSFPRRVFEALGSLVRCDCFAYNEFFHPLRCERQIGFAFPLPKGQIALGWNCAGRDYSEDDRQLLTLLRPHLMQAYANALTLARITSAMTGMTRACIIAGEDGAIEYASAAAVHLLQKYFDLSAEPTQLPPQLTHWLLKPAGVGQKTGPFEIERDAVRLVVSLARRDADGTCSLLLEETSDTILKTRLVSAGLTLREAEVLLWVTRGKASSEIAVILGSKTATVSKHLEHVYQKLGVENRTAAANAASKLIAST